AIRARDGDSKMDMVVFPYGVLADKRGPEFGELCNGLCDAEGERLKVGGTESKVAFSQELYALVDEPPGHGPHDRCGNDDLGAALDAISEGPLLRGERALGIVCCGGRSGGRLCFRWRCSFRGKIGVYIGRHQFAGGSGDLT